MFVNGSNFWIKVTKNGGQIYIYIHIKCPQKLFILSSETNTINLYYISNVCSGKYFGRKVSKFYGIQDIYIYIYIYRGVG